MRKLWRGEVIRKQSSPREQGDCAFDKYLTEIGSTHNSDTHVASILESESLQLLHGSRIQEQALLQPLKAEDPGESRDTILLPILDHQTVKGMTSIVGNYQHQRNDNLDEYFKAVGMFKSATKTDCGMPYDDSKNKYDL